MRARARSALLALAAVLLLRSACAQDTPPANVTGAFRGTWASAGSAGAEGLWTHHANGSVHVSVATRPSGTEGVHAVKADITLSAAEFVGARDDLHLAAQGLYVPTTGELRLLVPRSRVFAEVSAAEAAAGGQAVRDAAVAAAAELAGGATQPRLSLPPHGNATGLRRACAFALTVRVPPARLSHHRLAVRLEGLLESAECGVALQLNASLVHTDALVVKANNAALLTAATGLLLIRLTSTQMEASAGGTAATRVSLACVCHQGVLDSILCLVHLTGGLMVESLFSAFLTTAMCFFVLFSFFEMRWMMSITRARSADVPWQTQLNALQSRFYLALVAGVSLFWLLRSWPVALSLAYGGFWWWQIVHSALTDGARPLHPHYVVGNSLARLPVPLYLLLCPENWLGLEPAPHAAAALVLSLALQAGVLCGQIAYGPRWFVPPSWRPQRYSYARPATAAERASAASDDAEAGGLDCVVCMMPLDLDALNERMLTPCGHAFHGPCLLRWMAVRLECPVCRRALPLP